MPDLACPYTLDTPVGTIIFNDDTLGVVDKYWIQDIPQGLAGAPIRAPADDLAYADGGVSYNWWEGPRDILIEGVFLVQSAPLCTSACVAVWNEMEENLRLALRSIAGNDTDTGTLTWTPTGQTERELTVRNNITLECGPDQNYLVRTFHFGLRADQPDWD